MEWLWGSEGGGGTAAFLGLWLKQQVAFHFSLGFAFLCKGCWQPGWPVPGSGAVWEEDCNRHQPDSILGVCKVLFQGSFGPGHA